MDLVRRPEFLARQGRCPSGLLGSIVGSIMAIETADENAAAIDLLRILPSDHVLEAGFGHGKTIQAIAQRLASGKVAGVDASATMLARAERVNHQTIRQGKTHLALADSQSLPYPDHHFDKLLSVHTVYFWRDPAIHFREFRRVLRPSGTMVIGFRPADASVAASFPSQIYNFRSTEEIRGLIREARFSIEDLTETCIRGRKIAFVTARHTATAAG